MVIIMMIIDLLDKFAFKKLENYLLLVFILAYF